MKKLLSLVLVLFVIFTTFSMLSVGVSAEINTDYPVIEEGEVKTVELLERGDGVCFRFTPEKTDYYAFYSIGADKRAYGSIHTLDWGFLAATPFDGGYDSEGLNFQMDYKMEAGTTYILQADFDSIYDGGTYQVVVKRIEPEYTYTLSEDKKATITDFPRMYHGELTIPSSLDGYPVVAIESFAFEYCGGLTSVVIPDGVVSIGTNAFAHCSDLKEIVIPDSVIQIGQWAFLDTAYYNDKSNWNNSVLYLDTFLIKAEDTLSGKYVIKPGTVVLADQAFEYCVALTEVTIPDSVMHMGDSTFSYTSLTDVVIPDRVTRIGNSMFLGCAKLEKVTIPATVTYIERYAFYGCEALQEIKIPGGVTFVGRQIFHECKNLKKVYFDNTVNAWEKIDIHEENETLFSAKIICQNGEVKLNADGTKVEATASATHNSKTTKPIQTSTSTTKDNNDNKQTATPVPTPEVTSNHNGTAETAAPVPTPEATSDNNSNAETQMPTTTFESTVINKNADGGNDEVNTEVNDDGNGLVVLWVIFGVVLLGGLSAGTFVFLKKRAKK